MSSEKSWVNLVILMMATITLGASPRVGPIYAPDGPASGRRMMAAPIVLKPGPQLFLDDYLIESTEHLERRAITLSRDPKIPNPIVTGKRPDGGDRNFQPFLTVLRDPQTQRFRMWYDVGVDASTSTVAYMESADGIHFERPRRELAKPNDVNFCVAVIDEGTDFAPVAERFKMAFFSKKHVCEIWASPNGLDWNFFAPGPSPTNDIIDFVRDVARDRYLITHGAPAVPADGYKGKTPNAPEGYRRLVGQSTSTDCRHWTPPKRIIMPGERDEGITEFYSVGGLLCRGDLIVGTLKVLRDDLPAGPGAEVHGIGYTTLAWTHDGENWLRESTPLLDRDSAPDAWDHAHAWIDCQLPVGDDVYLYYGGYKRGHKVNRMEERQIGLLKMKRDRYVAREAHRETGLLRTSIVALQGKRITVNVEPIAGGEVTAQIIGDDAKPIEGFSFEDCKPVTSDRVDAPIKWRGGDVPGGPVRLEFSVKHARIYGFDVH